MNIALLTPGQVASQGRLAGKVALVTGAAHGIGRAIATSFAAQGAAVGILDLKLEHSQRVVKEIVDVGGRAMAFAGDVALRDSVRNAVTTLENGYGRFDILVSNAIWARYGPTGEITPETLERMVGSGFNSIVWGIQAAESAMTRSGGGSIINIASMAAYVGIPQSLVYSGVKAGVIGLTRAAAAEYGPLNIRVNAVAPGTTLTEGVTKNIGPTALSRRKDLSPLRRLGTVQDISAAVMFLASEESAFITGQCLLVDGGMAQSIL